MDIPEYVHVTFLSCLPALHVLYIAGQIDEALCNVALNKEDLCALGQALPVICTVYTS